MDRRNSRLLLCGDVFCGAEATIYVTRGCKRILYQLTFDGAMRGISPPICTFAFVDGKSLNRGGVACRRDLHVHTGRPTSAVSSVRATNTKLRGHQESGQVRETDRELTGKR